MQKVLLRCSVNVNCVRQRGGDETTTRSRTLFYTSLPTALYLQSHSLPRQGAKLGMNHHKRHIVVGNLQMSDMNTRVSQREQSEITVDDVGVPLLLLNGFSVCHQERKNRQKRPLRTCQLALKLSQKTLFLMQHCKKERNVTFKYCSTYSKWFRTLMLPV